MALTHTSTGVVAVPQAGTQAPLVLRFPILTCYIAIARDALQRQCLVRSSADARLLQEDDRSHLGGPDQPKRAPSINHCKHKNRVQWERAGLAHEHLLFDGPRPQRRAMKS